MAESFPSPSLEPEPVYSPVPPAPAPKKGLSTGAKVAIGCGAAALLCLCAAGVVLLGIGMMPDYQADLAPTSVEIVETAVPVFDLGDDSEAYANNVFENTTSYADTLEELAGLFTDVENDPELVRDDAWRDEVFALLDDLEMYAHQLVSVDPPAEFAESHGWLLQVESETVALNENFRDGVEDEDMGALYRAIENIDNINDALEKATDTLPEP